MGKSAIAMDAGEIAALENEELSPAETTVEKEPIVEVADKKGGNADEPEFVAEPEEGEKPKVATKKPDDGKPKTGEKPRTTVPHEALHAEREEHKKTRAELQAQQVRQARLEERITAINDAMARQPPQRPAPQAPEKIPTVNDDAMAALAWTQQQVIADRQARERAQQEWSERAQQEQAQTQGQQQAAAEWNQAFRKVGGDWEKAAAENPQITDAYNALRQSYATELKALGWVGQQDIQAELNRIEQGQILHCYRNGAPIDEFVTQLAAARAGWKPKAEGGNEEPEPEVKNGRANENADTLKRLAKAQDASDTLSGIGGGPGGNRISLETLDHMPTHEFDALIAKLSKKGESEVDRVLAKMMGVPSSRTN